jgi:hypothetical protein
MLLRGTVLCLACMRPWVQSPTLQNKTKGIINVVARPVAPQSQRIVLQM